MSSTDQRAPDPWAAYAPSQEAPWDLRRVVHLHRGAGFAATWEELQRDLKDGPGPAVERLLTGTSRSRGVPDDFAVHAARLARLAVAGRDLGRLKAWWVYRLLLGPDPLAERLTLFWHNHFATSAAKAGMTVYRQNEVFRELGRGPFGAGRVGRVDAEQRLTESKRVLLEFAVGLEHASRLYRALASSPRSIRFLRGDFCLASAVAGMPRRSKTTARSSRAVSRRCANRSRR